MKLSNWASWSTMRSSGGNQGKNLEVSWRLSPPKSEAGGFTLIEMIVVVVIIAMIAAFSMPSISSYFQVSLNSATRDLATIIKEAYNSTIITGKVHRLVYDLTNHSYWVESGPMEVLLDTKETKEKDERKKRFSRSVEAPKSDFMMDKLITRKKIGLPRGVTYEDIITQQSTTPITEGMAYTHFFPHGLTEQTVIHLQDQSTHHVSLVITPLVGMTDLYDRYVSGKELFEKQ